MKEKDNKTLKECERGLNVKDNRLKTQNEKELNEGLKITS